MKNIFLLIAVMFVFTASSLADVERREHTVSMKFVSGPKLEAGKEITIRVQLTDMTDGKPLTFAGLETVHTKKFHLLIIEPTLTDYQHVHPAETEIPGEYEFSFTPQKNGTYRFWADLKPVKTGEQEYAIADLGTASGEAVIEKKENNEATVGGYNFKLSFENKLREGSATIGTIKVTDKNGKPVEYLEPVLGAFAHIACFGEDYKTLVHIHPMGKEPKTAEEKGGPELEFHIEPKTSGFVKMFVQVKIKGKTLFVPFGLNVKYQLAQN